MNTAHDTAAQVLKAAANTLTEEAFVGLMSRVLREFARRQAQVGMAQAIEEAAEWHPLAPAIILGMTEALAAEMAA